MESVRVRIADRLRRSGACCVGSVWRAVVVDEEEGGVVAEVAAVVIHDRRGQASDGFRGGYAVECGPDQEVREPRNAEPLTSWCHGVGDAVGVEEHPIAWLELHRGDLGDRPA